ncbi:MAG: 4Fe-4S binding protein [Deltaproteobacteria bacterium]|nr:4Fe-4S binding protein [Deltaproteobacteria bacterium]
MADGRTDTGSGEDLQIQVSRCLRMRFSESSCRQCVDICPHEAVTLDGGLSLNPDQCHGCLLCTSVCPAGALEHGSDFAACLAQLSRVPEPLLGCIRTKENSNAAVACLGGLSEEHLLVLCLSLPDVLTLNLSDCADCTNNAMINHLRQRVSTLSEAGLLSGGCRMLLTESASELRFQGEAFDRRNFFKSLRSSLFQGVAAILSTTCEQTEQRSEYARKYLPVRRVLLNKNRSELPQELAVPAMKQFDSIISFGECCTRCQGCVAICPTGALKSGLPDAPPGFDQLLCTGCGVCTEFCLDGAVRLSRFLD